MSEKIQVYFLEKIDMLLAVDFNATLMFKYELSPNDPRIKFISRKSVVLITEDEDEAYIQNCYRDPFRVSYIAKREVRKIYERLSPIGKERADKELRRIETVVRGDLEKEDLENKKRNI